VDWTMDWTVDWNMDQNLAYNYADWKGMCNYQTSVPAT